MKEILFRGKRIDNGEWVYGYYKVGVNGRTTIFDISSESLHIVIPETVGQYVGLKDKNGKKIYEGDIVNIFFRVDDYEYNYVVGEIQLLSDDLWFSDQNEIVGNIHDLDLTEVE